VFGYGSIRMLTKSELSAGIDQGYRLRNEILSFTSIMIFLGCISLTCIAESAGYTLPPHEEHRDAHVAQVIAAPTPITT